MAFRNKIINDLNGKTYLSMIFKIIHIYTGGEFTPRKGDLIINRIHTRMGFRISATLV